jgi:hypothetical protein
VTIRTTAERREVLAMLDFCTMHGEREDLARLRDMLRVPGTGLYWTATGRRATLAVAIRTWRKLEALERERERREFLTER